MSGSAPASGEAEFLCPADALDTLRRRTNRVARITPLGDQFRLRYRSVDLGGVHLSRTWERNARFEIEGEAIPAIFFPLQGSTRVTESEEANDRTVRTGGCFTVARRARFEPQPGYSELVIVLDPDLLRRCLDSLGVREPLHELLIRAAMRTDLPGLARLRAVALDAFGIASEPQRSRFADLYRPVVIESIALHAACILAETSATMDSGTANQVGAPTHAALSRATEYILARLTDPLPAEDIANESGVSIRRLQVLFKDAHGCSPRDFILARRLDRARDLLTRRLVATVTDAALCSGLNHLGRFSDAYASRFGETPSRTLRGSD
jgi:AraC-like DNA-binding protein